MNKRKKKKKIIESRFRRVTSREFYYLYIYIYNEKTNFRHDFNRSRRIGYYKLESSTR